MQYSATILNSAVTADLDVLDGLRTDPKIDIVDRAEQMAATLRGLRPPVDAELLAEPRRWAYFPWRRTVVSMLGPRGFTRTRLDRNRHLITEKEQHRLSRLRVGVVGLSVGHAIAHLLAAQGLCGELHLADFDELELTNLNRVPATLFDIGVNKAVAAARRIAEIDPYLTVKVFGSGISPDAVTEFVAGVDIVTEECDSLDIKALLREVARAERRPVLMATSDRGLIDVERFDLEPQRPIFHGLLGDTDLAQLRGLTNREKIPHVLRILDAASLSPRGAASLIEVGHTLSTWPQLAADATLGAAAIAEAVRRIGLGENLPSGRGRVDVASVLDGLTDPISQHSKRCSCNASRPTPNDAPPEEAHDAVDAMVAAAVRAPSGGNAQPWHIEATPNAVTISVAPQHKSMMDVGFRRRSVQRQSCGRGAPSTRPCRVFRVRGSGAAAGHRPALGRLRRGPGSAISGARLERDQSTPRCSAGHLTRRGSGLTRGRSVGRCAAGTPDVSFGYRTGRRTVRRRRPHPLPDAGIAR
jgi:molybdopterin/thiamine biosynthesis adenylyltransferase